MRSAAGKIDEMTKRTLARAQRLGFTLVELLVVMAIMAIILGLIFGPMVQSFDLTNRARVQVLAQDAARSTMETLQRDVSNGVFIFDNANQPINIWFHDSGAYPNLRTSTAHIKPIQVPFGMIDFVPPARANDQNTTLTSGEMDPTTGLAINGGGVSLPLSPGRVIVRYWLGLRNNASHADGSFGTTGQPVQAYENYYENVRATDARFRTLQPAEHNPVMLYRAVLSPYLPSGQVDLRLFHATLRDPSNANGPQDPVLYDPNFFYDSSVAQQVTLADGTKTNQVPGWRDDNGDGQVNVCENWRAIARAMAPTDRADEVALTRDDKHNIQFDSNTGLPFPTPQVRFQPTYVGSDAGAPTSAGDVAAETPYAAPVTYVQTNGAWTLPYRLYTFRSNLSANPLTFYFADGDGQIYYNEYNTGSGQYKYAFPGQLVQYQTASYRDPRMTNPRSIFQALVPGKRPDLMFTVDVKRGLVNFSFPHWFVLHDSSGSRLPTEYLPTEPNATFDAIVQAVMTQEMAGGTNAGQAKLDGELRAYRYVSLAKLDPSLSGNLALGNGIRPPLEVQADGRTYIPNVRIVPGSEVVQGPDMLPGPHYGQLITYTRVPRTAAGFDPKTIGPNQYMINYTDLPNKRPPDPTLTAQEQAAQVALQSAGTILFDSQPDDPSQPVRHALPTVSYASDGTPQGPDHITVSYQIQNNFSSDIVKADYLTRELVTVALGMRLYDYTSGQPQQVTLTQKIKVRNLQR